MTRGKNSPPAVTCCRCGNKIEGKDTHWPQVVGFMRPKAFSGQSGSSLVLRARTGKVACNACVTAEVHGVNVGQGRL